MKLEITLPEKKKCAWPDKSAVMKLVWLKPLIHAAADIGVSDVARKKHCVKVGIKLPSPGHWLRERRPQACDSRGKSAPDHRNGKEDLTLKPG